MKIITATVAACAVLLLAACSAEVNENRPLNEIKTEASGMSQLALKRTVEAYDEAIDDLEDAKEKLEREYSDIPLLDKMKPESRHLPQQIAGLAASIEKLKARKALYSSLVR